MRSALPSCLLVCLSACATAEAAHPGPHFPPLHRMPDLQIPALAEANGEIPTPVPTASVASVSLESESSVRPLSSASRSLARLGRRFAKQDSGPGTVPISAAADSSSTHDGARGAGQPSRKEMLDVEATLNIVVENVGAAAATVRGIARAAGAMVSEDVVEEGTHATARFTLRVDAAKTEDLLAACEKVGQVRSRLVNARDIGKEYHDAELLLQNLEAAMKRYEEILKQANQVSDVLAIERELGRLRAQMDGIKGSLVWMRDRVLRSTVHVHLASLRAEEPISFGTAKIFPGIRLAAMADLRGDDDTHGYLGAGLSLRFHRHFGLDLDGYRRQADGWGTKLDVLIATMGGEIFSSFLGSGRRRFMNPYLGWRLGYARFEKRHEFAFAGAIGVEVVKSRLVSLDVAARLFGFIGEEAHMGVQPALSVNVAF